VIAQIIILNGVGSVGKSSTAKALQEIAETPFLHVSMDAFLDMLPASMFGHRDGLVFEALEEDGRPSVAIHTGPVMDRAMRGMRRAIAAMAEAGNNLIVDDVMLGDEQRDYRALLAAHKTRFVGLFASLAVLEAREQARGDRAIGLARWQHLRVHEGLTYDLEIDTETASPMDCALKIKAAFRI
jgi:chloramphenicol 3-O phosphotransferase